MELYHFTENMNFANFPLRSSSSIVKFLEWQVFVYSSFGNELSLSALDRTLPRVNHMKPRQIVIENMTLSKTEVRLPLAMASVSGGTVIRSL